MKRGFENMELRGKKVLVIGAARSGLAAGNFFSIHGANVYLNDLKNEEELPKDIIKSLNKIGVKLILGEHVTIEKLMPEIIIVSPGVPLSIQPLIEARKRGIPIWSEMELAAQNTRASMVAVTGTNGKTTTTELLGIIFADSGRNTFVGGNIGVPFISKAEDLLAGDVAVLETSSFQLETIQKFKPHIALILNITPDHIDRHGTFIEYINAKAKIFVNQDKNDWLILNWDDLETRKLADKAKSNVLFFSRRHNLKEGFCVENGFIVAKIGRKVVRILEEKDLLIKGGHNTENALAAVAAAWTMGVSVESMAKSLKTFPGVPHRLENVLTYKGVKYINDSKGTNPDASIKALDAYEKPIILIAGGKSKGSDFLPFAEKIKEKVKDLILIGQASDEIEKAVKQVGYSRYHKASGFQEAVTKASFLAIAGDIVLLSPACASFDMFDNFEHRGDVFKELVNNLAL